MFKSNKGPRYQVRFNNGSYHIVDTVQYRAVASRGLRKMADAEAAKRNAGPRF